MLGGYQRTPDRRPHEARHSSSIAIEPASGPDADRNAAEGVVSAAAPQLTTPDIEGFFMRSDKRPPNQLRETTITPHYLPHAEGSVLIEAGRTK